MENDTRKIEIDKIRLQIGELKLELTLAEAKNLQSTLNNLLGQTIYYPTYPVTYPYTTTTTSPVVTY